MLWLGPATILPARLLKGTLSISIISSPVFVGILPGGAGEPGPGSGCSVAPFMCMEFVLFGLYKVSFCTAQKWFFFRFLFFFFFNLKVSRGEPLSPVPSLYPPTLQPPVAAVTSLVPGQRDPAPAWPFASSLPFGCTLFTCFAQPCSSAHWPVLQVQGCGVCSPGLCPLLQHPGAELGPPALLLRAAAGPGCAPGLCGQPGAPWCQPGLCWATACSSARLPLHLLSMRGCSEGLSPQPCMRLWG